MWKQIAAFIALALGALTMGHFMRATEQKLTTPPPAPDVVQTTSTPVSAPDISVAPDVTDVPDTTVYDDRAAEFLSLINSRRKTPLTMDPVLTASAQLRAAEIKTNFAAKNSAEILMASYELDTKGMFNSWINADEDKKKVLDEGYNKIGFGFIEQATTTPVLDSVSVKMVQATTTYVIGILGKLKL